MNQKQSLISFTENGKPIHTSKYRVRRIMNWLPLGLTYAFLYMARYNLTVSKNALGNLMTKEDFGIIFAVGTITYAFSFLINGPLTDKFGGKSSILAAAGGSAIMNLLMGFFLYGILSLGWQINLTIIFSILYAFNMYFQSFGAVAIVKVNSAWFHVKERGVFGGIFGILISLGLYFAFDWSQFVVNTTVSINPQNPSFWFVFWIPAFILLFWFLIDIFIIRDNPSQAGYENFNTGDATSGEDDAKYGLLEVIKKIFTNKIIIIVGLIEFCTGVIRNGVMHWFPIYAKENLESNAAWNFWLNNWGLILMIAGASGGMIAGWMSDKLFGSRRAPVAGILYASILVAAICMNFTLYDNPIGLGLCVSIISIAVIGTHGMLSGTATMDFGGKKAAGTAVGLIDGLVYLGTGVQSLSLGFITTRNWAFWPLFLIPFILIGIFLTITIWNAFPKGKSSH